MISAAEAKKLIAHTVLPLPSSVIQLKNAWNLVLADDVFAAYDIPAFPQSSMDGYAINYNELQNNSSLPINGQSAAGDVHEIRAEQNTAVRIFTGAPVPEGTDTVVMQEKTKTVDGRLVVEDDQLLKGSNVRPAGSEIRMGDKAMAKGSVLSAAALGFLAGIGISEVTVYSRPKIGIIVTGNELISPGNPPAYGQVFESNSFALSAALQQFHHHDITVAHAPDNVGELEQLLRNFLAASDLVLLTGGVSVGEYDFVMEAAESCGVETVFHKVAQRPGKPLFFGRVQNKYVFGLPGNPSSVLTCFYEYVLIALEHLTKINHRLPVHRVSLAVNFNKKISFTQYLKGQYDGFSVTPLHAQESYRMHSFATANCLIVLDEQIKEYTTGEKVEIHLIN